MSADSITGALDAVIKETAIRISLMNKEVTIKMEKRNYQGAKDQIETIERLSAFYERLIELGNDWRANFDTSAGANDEKKKGDQMTNRVKRDSSAHYSTSYGSDPLGIGIDKI
jgi:hypothetical protein